MNDRKRPDYDSLKNIHLDVHGLRKDIRDAITKSQKAVLNAVEHSQSALMMRLSLIEGKIGTGGITPDDAAELAALLNETKAIAEQAEALAGSQ